MIVLINYASSLTWMLYCVKAAAPTDTFESDVTKTSVSEMDIDSYVTTIGVQKKGVG